MNNDGKAQTVEVDVRGQVCPSTLLVAMDSLNKNRDGIRDGLVCLSIKTDNREATSTIPGTAESMGYAVQVSNMEGYYQIDICSSPLADDNL